ncbi:hypothetical protein V1477_003951 [Vespula maculifrons]|uniref:Uncharacterized protein n=1 Tax=Vespula maculifrons TaxID=7453 RepID=A0ABD2CSH3_VESMC
MPGGSLSCIGFGLLITPLSNIYVLRIELDQVRNAVGVAFTARSVLMTKREWRYVSMCAGDSDGGSSRLDAVLVGAEQT